MLRELETRASKRKLQRKLRLFNCACCRRIWPLIERTPFRAIVEATERYCDGQGTLKDVKAIRESAWSAWAKATWRHDAIGSAIRAAFSVSELRRYSSRWAARAAAGWTPDHPVRAKQRAERASQAALVREIFGNPFRPLSLDPAWLHWNDGTIPRLAQAIHDERAFDRMPVLADALEEAGCADGAILNHCCQSDGHVLGCWVVDLALGNE